MDIAENIFLIISALINVIAGGGWFINHKLKKRAENANTEISELKAREANFEYYIKRIADLEARLIAAEKTIKVLEENLNKK
jgi:predicted RNase H-like nuclease (RuvC/YqgF family)